MDLLTDTAQRKETKLKTSALTLAAALLAGSVPVFAAPVQWNVDIRLTTGGTVKGSYLFDADTGFFSDIMVAALGPEFPATSASLTSYLPAFSSPSNLDFVPGVPDLTGFEDVYISLSSPMTNAGGVIGVNFVQTYSCSNSDCSTWDSFLQYSVESDSTVSNVPEPTGFALVTLGMIGLAVTRRRKRRAS